MKVKIFFQKRFWLIPPCIPPIEPKLPRLPIPDGAVEKALDIPPIPPIGPPIPTGPPIPMPIPPMPTPPIPIPGMEPAAGMIAGSADIPGLMPGNMKCISKSRGLFASSSALTSSFFLIASVLYWTFSTRVDRSLTN